MSAELNGQKLEVKQVTTVDKDGKSIVTLSLKLPKGHGIPLTAANHVPVQQTAIAKVGEDGKHTFELDAVAGSTIKLVKA